MKKISDVKIGIIAIVCSVLIAGRISYNNFGNLDIYSQEISGNIVSKDGTIYKLDEELTNTYLGGRVMTDKVIGRFEGRTFFETLFSEPTVVKLADYDEKNIFLVRGFMFKKVYKKS